MAIGAHRIGRLDIRADIANLDLAYALRPRIETLGWRLMPRVLEQVFDALVPRGAHLRLDRLDLDLGRLRPDHLEADALRALEIALTEALSRAIAQARVSPSEQARLVDPPGYALAQFEAYLASGIAPHVSLAAPFDPALRLRALAEAQPSALVAMLRRRARDRHVLERLVLQAGDAGLRALLAVLAPADAAAIIAIIADIVAVHVDQALAPLRHLTQAGLTRLLYVTTLEFLLRDAGSQFNRRRFLGFLLAREAMRAGIDFDALLDLLAASVELASARFGLRPTLPRTLSELLDEVLAERRRRPPPPRVALTSGMQGTTLTPLAPGIAPPPGALGTVLPPWLPGTALALPASGIVPPPGTPGVATTSWPPGVTRAPERFAVVSRREEPGTETCILAETGILADIAILAQSDVAAWQGVDPAALIRRIQVLVMDFLAEAGNRPADRRAVWRHVLDCIAGDAGLTGPAGVDPWRGQGKRRTGRATVALARRFLSLEDFAVPVRHLPQEDAAAILADLAALATGPARTGGRPRDATALAALLRALTLEHLLRLGGERFGRHIFRRHLLAGIARRNPTGPGAHRARPAASVAPRRAGMARHRPLRAGGADAPARGVDPIGIGPIMSRREPRTAPVIALPIARPEIPFDGAGPDALDAGGFAALVGGLALGHLLGAHRVRFDRLVFRRHLRAELARRAAFLRSGAAPPDGPTIAGAEGTARGNAEWRAGAGDPASLTFDALVRRLAPRDASEILAVFDDLVAALTAETQAQATMQQETPPPRTLAQEAPAQQTPAQGSPAQRAPAHPDTETIRHRIEARLPEVLASAADAPFDRAAIEARLHAVPTPSHRRTAAAREMPEPGPVPEHTVAATVHRDRALRYLRTGLPRDGGQDLPGLAATDPAWLATQARALVRETPSIAALLAERLLGFLLPGELLRLFAPGGADRNLPGIDGLPGGDDTVWQASVTALLRDEPAPPIAATRSLGARLDRLAGIGHWLTHDTEAAWPPDAEPVAALLEDLPDLPVVELSALFLAETPDATLAGLDRAVDRLDPDRRMRLFARLAPWATNQSGPLAPLLAPLDAARRQHVLLRAAAAAVAGTGIDLAALTRPIEPTSLPPQPPAGPRAPETAPVGHADLLAWLDGAPADAAQTARLVDAFAALADASDPALAAYLAASRSRNPARANWAAVLPRRALGRLLGMLVPGEAQALLDGALLIAVAWRQVAPFGAHRPSERAFNAMLLDLVAKPGAVDLAASVAVLMQSLTNGHASQSGKLRDRSLRLAREGGYGTLAAALRRPPRPPARPKPQAAPQQAAPPPRAGRFRTQTPAEPAHAMFVGNAGLVLLNPFLPALFERLGVLTPDDTGVPHIAGLEAASRAVHLLQYLADGRLDRPEPELVLNKLLCGQKVAQPVLPVLHASQADLQLCDELLHAVIANWKVLRNSSTAALRETFLQREGRLQRSDAKWLLQVQRKTLDVLTDQIPWSFAVVYHRWMAGPIHVTW